MVTMKSIQLNAFGFLRQRTAFTQAIFLIAEMLSELRRSITHNPMAENIVRQNVTLVNFHIYGARFQKRVPKFIQIEESMKFEKLSKLAELQTGLVLRRKEAKSDTKNPKSYLSLNLKSINIDGSIDKGLLESFQAEEEIDTRFLTMRDDIIVGLLPPFRTVQIVDSFLELIVPSQFVIIRIKNQKITPDFLQSYLSQTNSLEKLAIRESGHVISSLTISGLSKLKIPVPDINTQRALAAYMALSVEHKQLCNDLIHQYDIKHHVIMKEAIEGRIIWERPKKISKTH